MNLSKYITNGLFVHNISSELEIQSIVFENFDNREALKDSPFKEKVTTIKNIGFKNLKQHVQTKGKTILILDKISLDQILEFISLENLIIIEPNAGISSKAKKFNIANDDLCIASAQKIKTLLPHDLGSFIDCLKSKNNLYLRIFNKEYPGSLIGDNKSNTGLLNLSALGYKGEKGTILCSGAYSGEITMAYNYFDENSSYDLFIVQDYNFKRVEELSASIKANENVFIIIDQKADCTYLNELKDELMQRKVKKNNIHIITPNYSKIISNIPEYMQESAGFDSMGLYNTIIKIK